MANKKGRLGKLKLSMKLFIDAVRTGRTDLPTKLIAQGRKVNQDKSLLTKKIQFSIFTWKTSSYPVNRNDPNLTVGKFLDYFYGYVAAQ